LGRRTAYEREKRKQNGRFGPLLCLDSYGGGRMQSAYKRRGVNLSTKKKKNLKARDSERQLGRVALLHGGSKHQKRKRPHFDCLRSASFPGQSRNINQRKGRKTSTWRREKSCEKRLGLEKNLLCLRTKGKWDQKNRNGGDIEVLARREANFQIEGEKY